MEMLLRVEWVNWICWTSQTVGIVTRNKRIRDAIGQEEECGSGKETMSSNSKLNGDKQFRHAKGGVRLCPYFETKDPYFQDFISVFLFTLCH